MSVAVAGVEEGERSVTGRCLCQSCFDCTHRCVHKRNERGGEQAPGAGPRSEQNSTYMADYLEHRWSKPRCLLIRDPYLTVGGKGYNLPPVDSVYQQDFIERGRRLNGECAKPLYRHPTEPMERDSVYSVSYLPPVFSKLRQSVDWLKDHVMQHEQMMRTHRSPLSHPRHPPRPYDYSKHPEPGLDRFLLVPRDLLTEEKNWETFKLPMSELHSDGAPDSYIHEAGGRWDYVRTSTAKDAYRAGMDIRGMSCCRPELKHHPRHLARCLSNQQEQRQQHQAGHETQTGTCPESLYGRPERALWSLDRPFTPRAYSSPVTVYSAHFRDPTTYNLCHRSGSIQSPDPHSPIPCPSSTDAHGGSCSADGQQGQGQHQDQGPSVAQILGQGQQPGQTKSGRARFKITSSNLPKSVRFSRCGE